MVAAAGEGTSDQDAAAAAARLFDGVERRDLDQLISVYDRDVEIHEPESLPYGGTYRGIAGALSHAQAYAAFWLPLQSEPPALEPRIAAAGDTATVTWRQRGSVEGAGVLDVEAVSVYRVRAGRIVESRMYHDTAAILAFAQRAAQSPHGRGELLQVTEARIHDTKSFLEYGARALPIVRNYGGALLAYTTEAPSVIEGDWRPQQLFLHRWRSRQDFDAFYESAEYRAARELRRRAADTNLVVFANAAQLPIVG